MESGNCQVLIPTKKLPVDGVLRAAVPVWTFSSWNTYEAPGTHKAVGESSFCGTLGMTSQANFHRVQLVLWPPQANEGARLVLPPGQTAKTQHLCKLGPKLLLLSLGQTLNGRSLGSHRCVDRDICHGVGQQTFVRRIQVDICQRQIRSESVNKKLQRRR